MGKINLLLVLLFCSLLCSCAGNNRYTITDKQGAKSIVKDLKASYLMGGIMEAVDIIYFTKEKTQVYEEIYIPFK